jgi:hypothetical protein
VIDVQSSLVSFKVNSASTGSGVMPFVIVDEFEMFGFAVNRGPACISMSSLTTC